MLSQSTQVYDNFLRNIMDIQCHLKQRYATAICKGVRVSVPISGDIGMFVPRLLSHFFFIFIAT